ncbi:hypothetical protein N7467_002629 [Penicillium canescens]|nr:hypothetical protein N7467_002629 [Penicillium canescens]
MTSLCGAHAGEADGPQTDPYTTTHELRPSEITQKGLKHSMRNTIERGTALSVLLSFDTPAMQGQLKREISGQRLGQRTYPTQSALLLSYKSV